MPLDPQAEAFIQAIPPGAKPLHESTVAEARRVGVIWPQTAPEHVARVEHRFICGPTADLPVRIYFPEGPGPFPAVVWFHGSGWVVCNLDVNDVPARALANRSGCVVIAVNYQKAPEHAFPIPLDDCYATLLWAHEQADALGIDPTRIGVGGDSAGGNLAAAVTLKARDEAGPRIAFQTLIYPVTDADFETESYVANAKGYVNERDTMRWFWDQYVPSAGERSHPYAAPLRAKSHADLPSAFVATAEYDPVLDEGEAYAKRLADAGVPVSLRRYEGMIHGFFLMDAALDQAKVLFKDCGDALRELASS